MPPLVTAVVVHYRGASWLRRCVKSCLLSEDVHEVLVVDNEGVGAELRSILGPEPRILQMGRNVGYGRAANVGLAASTGDAVLVLNQDVVVSDEAVEAMLDAGDGAEAWLVGPRLIGPDGVAATPKEGFPPPLEWEAPARSGPGWRDRPWIPGAAMLFMPGHTDLRFDERLFMFGEDEELCWRVWASGGRVIEARSAEVGHEGGTAVRTRWTRTGIASRTILARARFVGWHRGPAAAGAYLGDAVRGALAKRFRRRG